MKPFTYPFNLKFVFYFLMITQIVSSQTTISGVIQDQKGVPIMGANVYLDGTYDGASTGENGNFSFTTSEEGAQTLIVSFLAYETYYFAATVNTMQNLNIKLKEDFNTLDVVVISAGTFEAGDNSKVSVLNALDVVTTASALGDFVGALQTLPGTTTVAEDGRLFVRGGEAGETQIFIDGIRVFTPFTPTTNNVPTRGRYSPFLFDGITFSTGGYSAEYGQALSSVLLLNTINEPAQEQTDISLMSVGAGVGNTQIWGDTSLSINTSYINLAPYFAIYNDRNDWEKPFETFAGETVFRQKTKNGIFKLYSAFDASNFELTQEDINVPEGVNFALMNNNLYTNASYKGSLGSNWQLETGGSYTRGENNVNVATNDIYNIEHSFHLKFKLRKRFSNQFKLHFGAEHFLTNFEENFKNEQINTFNLGFNNNISATFLEADYIFSKKFAAKGGVRAEYTALFDEFTFSPRLSLAYKTSKHSQLSLAYGDYFQQQQNDFLKFTTLPINNSTLQSQKSTHYLANYQYSNNDRVFRAEVFLKNYNNLITFNDAIPSFQTIYGTNGEGFAQGLDLFWRDNKSIKNVDYWVSYSYLDSKRDYLNYPVEATPPFVNTHNFSVVTKHWVESLKSQIGFSYQFASGRTFTDPNREGFLQETTKDFNNLSFNWAYLISPQKILYFSVNNLLGINNINGYQFADTPNSMGIFDRLTLRPNTDQFFFVGFFWTISSDGTTNQLDNL